MVEGHIQRTHNMANDCCRLYIFSNMSFFSKPILRTHKSHSHVFLLPRYGCAYECGILVSKTKVDQEDDSDAEDEDPGGDAVVGEAKAADGEEENAADKVDEELKLRDAAANDVVEEDAGDDDGIADNNSLPKIADAYISGQCFQRKGKD